LLGLANSAYFGYPGTVTNLKVAIINVLGTLTSLNKLIISNASP
jgi:HD-like signal output (HDOD) protein